MTEIFQSVHEKIYLKVLNYVNLFFNMNNLILTRKLESREKESGVRKGGIETRRGREVTLLTSQIVTGNHLVKGTLNLHYPEETKLDNGNINLECRELSRLTSF